MATRKLKITYLAYITFLLGTGASEEADLPFVQRWARLGNWVILPPLQAIDSGHQYVKNCSPYPPNLLLLQWSTSWWKANLYFS